MGLLRLRLTADPRNDGILLQFATAPSTILLTGTVIASPKAHDEASTSMSNHYGKDCEVVHEGDAILTTQG